MSQAASCLANTGEHQRAIEKKRFLKVQRNEKEIISEESFILDNVTLPRGTEAV